MAAEDEFEESKLDVPAHASPSAPLTSPSEPQPVTENALHETLRSETPLQPQNVGHFTPALLLSAKASTDTDTITNNLQAQVLPSRRTVVVTIQFPNEISSKPQHVMTTVADNTRAAMFDAVNSYLDSKNVLKRMQGQRELEIKCGVGRNGDVDVSTVEETMWPEYLDYFRQYTRIPELTVQVMGC